eukprot:CAMPEP_0202701900 /NCGR_PEP_ID=MMETSP1385-20130828/14941_1 /ASSEMBLY_ACC=CAM_ASM_000861 /TAXON_ID=933848 /ORGANISM="Elphidium margaritaceum" /LENGTH=93 /DNA_ID=CAMNT_0049359417 /DNA_START=33 /DNA_END=311 /DNA_ORIENTATION=+
MSTELPYQQQPHAMDRVQDTKHVEQLKQILASNRKWRLEAQQWKDKFEKATMEAQRWKDRFGKARASIAKIRSSVEDYDQHEQHDDVLATAIS